VVTEESSRKASVKATARAWQQQVVLNRPLSAQQLIQEQDITERRALVDRLSGEQLLSRDQVVGQQAALDLKPGTIVTARMIESVPLARSGQLVTVVLNAGKVQVKTVARALESGSFGQTIRVRNEATRDVLEVILTGPQTARLGGEAPALSTPNVVSRVE
jgi:flagella basal body P-ring formation protein FlgA